MGKRPKSWTPTPEERKKQSAKAKFKKEDGETVTFEWTSKVFTEGFDMPYAAGQLFIDEVLKDKIRELEQHEIYWGSGTGTMKPEDNRTEAEKWADEWRNKQPNIPSST